MPALIQFVDSISASPTVRLDINDSAAWFCTNFSAPLPRLRRSESGNSMRDGGVVGSATYENRTLEIELTLVNTSTEDAAATEMQKLWRELDRPTNYLRYQREGMTKPVFFRLFRSDASDFEELWTTPIARNISIEILAEPFALGLAESLGPFTVKNDPASGPNPTYVDLPAILGDVPVPLVYWDSSSASYGNRWLTSWATTSPVHMFGQAESMTLVSGTTNPGGSADAAFSGSGTTNYVVTNFSGATAMTGRVRWPLTGAFSGTWRIFAFVSLTSSASGYSVRARVGLNQTGQTVTVPTGSVRMRLDLGLFSLGSASAVTAGYSSSISNPAGSEVVFEAAGPTTTTLRWDCFVMIPAGDQLGTVGLTSTAFSGAANAVLDGVQESAGGITSGGNPITGTGDRSWGGSVSGSFPVAYPGVSNRIYVMGSGSTLPGETTLASTVAANITYWPRYLYIRPVST